MTTRPQRELRNTVTNYKLIATWKKDMTNIEGSERKQSWSMSREIPIHRIYLMKNRYKETSKKNKPTELIYTVLTRLPNEGKMQSQICIRSINIMPALHTQTAC
jgi:hypothetical protein